MVSLEKTHQQQTDQAGGPQEEAALWRSLRLLKAQQEASRDAILVVDERRRVVSYNQRFCRLWDVPDGLIQAEGHPSPLTCVASRVREPEPFLAWEENLFQRPDETALEQIALQDGRTFDCYSAPLSGEDAALAGRVWYFRDITDHKWAEAELERVLSQSEQIVASISSILITVDERGDITTWNGGAAAAFGRPAAAVLDTPFAACGVEWDWPAVWEAVAQCTAGRQPVRLDDMTYVTPDGRDRLLGVTLNPINNFCGEPKGFLLLGADITERRQLERQLAHAEQEKQLAHAQKLESIGQLAAGIAHEINTPIQYVGDNTRFLRDAMADLRPVLDAYRSLADAAEACADVAAVREAERRADVDYLVEEIPTAITQSLEGIERVAHIVRAMKEFSHPGTADKVMTDLNGALESTLTVARNEWKYVADAVTDFEKDLPLTPCFPADLNQVFLNMIVNAAHAIADVVGDGARGKGTITVGTRSAGGSVEIRISDTGAGMTEAVKARIFDPFFTTKPVGKGTGQGLAISHAVVVEKHGGVITVDTAPGAGTTFLIRLPLTTDTPEAP